MPSMENTETSFNTWAREEPNIGIMASCVQSYLVSILGLARSPTIRSKSLIILFIGFNTWAREEPNPPDGGNICTVHHVSILGLARSPTQETRAT